MDFRNCYEDDAYAAAYAKLEFPGTYYLAFRDLPGLLSRHVRGRRALDFGCGTGRSTRFLAKHGFQAVGVDVAAEMVDRAHTIDPTGDYRMVSDGDLREFEDACFDLILAAFTFDNVPTRTQKVALFRELRRLLRADGRMVNLVSAPEIYWHEWASFSTRDFPENRRARCGDPVRIVVTALEDRRPAVDVLWPDDAYRDVFAEAGLQVHDVHRPLGRPSEPYDWVSETTTAPWTIYVLGLQEGGAEGSGAVGC
ncbi:MAG: class I SAM-dependent methyltransferase [Phycisphaerae bacterium]|nr:class I SAM-dependent methyltransferase [Phycisphaerae bacterium]